MSRLFWIFIAMSAVSILVGSIQIMRQPPIEKPRSHRIDLPAKPYKAEHLPVLRAKLEALNSDAAVITKTSPHLSAKEEKKVSQVWEEIFYTPGYYPEFVRVRTIEIAKVVQHRPQLAAHLELVKQYQDGRYAIVNDAVIVDKAAAIAALNKRLGPGLKNPEYARQKEKFMAARRELTGDRELDEADLRYQRFMRAELVKCLPELASYYRESESHYEGWTAVMGEANALAREIKALEGQPFVGAQAK
jgi:hypothetical protein